MKRRNHIALAFLLPFLAGCGEEVNTGLHTDETVRPLALGVLTEVAAGDRVEPEGEGTVITVSHDLEHSVKYVTLVSGSASLVEGGEQ